MVRMSELVSVVIPVYNAEKYLQKSIESVLAQTYSNIEIICIDDGSTDKSLEILKQYSTKIIIISQKNQGLSSALNIGVQQMKGKWLKWFSPDDVLHSNAIETLVKNANQLPDNSIVYSNWTMINEKGKKIREFYESDYNDLTRFNYAVRLLDSQQINVNTSLIPKIVIDTLSGFRSLSNSVTIDYDFFLRAAIITDTNFFLVNQPLIKYRIHKNQLSHKYITKSLISLEDVKKNILSNLSLIDQEKYKNNLFIYRKNKSFFKKILILSQTLTNYLPRYISDRFFTFYIKNIRTNR